MPTPAFLVEPTPDALARAAAERIVALAGEAIGQRGAFHIALSGGSTPRRLHAALAGDGYRDRIDWSRVHIWFGDERSVAPDHPDSNYRMARETLLDRAPIPPAQVHRMCAEQTHLWRGVGDYAQALGAHLPADARGRPRLDLVLLGMGPDGHTASLFPRTCILGSTRPVAAVYVPRLKTWRMSLTYPVLNAARHVLLLVAGADKADMLRRVLKESPDGEPLPVQGVQPVDGTLEWYLDEAAGALVIGD